MKKYITFVSIFLLLVCIISILIHNFLISLFPLTYGDYIVYEGNVYYPANDERLGGPIEDPDEKLSVRLYKNDGRRIGIFQRFYAYKVSYDEEGIFLNFDSRLFTRDLDLVDEKRLP